MRNFTITDKQICSIHNAMCQMHLLHDTLNDMFKTDSVLLQRFNDAFNKLKPVRDELMKLKDDHDDRIREQAAAYAKKFGFSRTIWSIYDIDFLINTSNVPPGSKIVSEYSDVSVTVEGYDGNVTWLDLWIAVEELANKTVWDESGRIGFGDHVFIEKFVPSDKNNNTYTVWLGS